MVELLLLGRPDCGLCEEFRAALVEAFPALASTLRYVDVDDHAGWRGRYGHVVPVLIDGDGTEICQTHFDAAALQRYLDGER